MTSCSAMPGALENPPLLITSDMDRIVVRTNFTNAVSERTEFRLDDLRDAAVRARLRTCWTEPDRWRPAVTRQGLTEKAAGEFAALARRLRERGHDPQAVAHFINRLVFCLFADDVGLLPDGLLAGMLDFAARQPQYFATAAAELFARHARIAAAGSASSRCNGSTASCSTTTPPCRSKRRTSRRSRGPRRSTGRRSTPPFSARCSSAGSTPTSGASSARITPPAR